MDTTDEEGVLPLSPAESSLGSSSASVLPPRSRARPLVSGSKKESWLIGRLDDMKLHVERFHARRRGVPPISSGGDIGYGTFDEAAADMTQIFNLVWMSSTPWLQVSYCISLATLVPEFLTSFEPAPGPALSLLNRLDVAFASLISGKNAESGTPMPGFERGSVISMTEKVRIKSIVDQTRMVAVKVLGSDYDADYGYHDDEMFPAEEEEDINPNMLPPVSKSDMSVAKVYQRTIGVLGKELGGTSPIGMITDD